jgi:hypothetical protein
MRAAKILEAAQALTGNHKNVATPNPNNTPLTVRSTAPCGSQ